MTIHPLKIGAIRCVVLSEGGSTFPNSKYNEYFSNVTPEEVQAGLVAIGHAEGTGASSMHPLVIESGGLRVLVDTGMGAAAQPQFGQLLPALAEAGLAPEQIDVVYITHFHGDHINGLMTNGTPTFPNARIITGRAEWQYWTAPDNLSENLQAILTPLKDRFSFADDGDDIAPGVRVIDLFGHTPGHTGLILESQGEQLWHLVDALHRTVQFRHPEWHHRFDNLPEVASETRRGWLAKAAEAGALVLFYHLPFPGLGHVQAVDDAAGDAFTWVPLAL
ncbi:MAG: MBL fold metallo-hydrolase [Anaerolineae bacterium]